MLRRILTLCLFAALAASLAACGANGNGLSVDGKVETGGPWKPYEGDWDAQPRDLPQAPGGHAAQPMNILQPRDSAPAAPGAAPAAPAGDRLPTYGIPALQRPQPAAPAEPSVQQVIRTEFPEPAPAPADAGYINIQP
ncbi:MAG: hypothetical protein E7022_07495 [Desulfovibrio desulfuricans]|jgi:hypothetical protein|nr:hypothetical protein [Desulfovibrio desulfuricans]